MSINHFINKIKGEIDIDSNTIVCLCVIILVGFCSFGLGRLSVLNNSGKDIKLENTNESIVKGEIGKSSQTESISGGSAASFKERMYVASKNGKLYYTKSCSGAKRISAKNEVWFASSEEAEKAGYTLSTSCK